MVPIIIAALLTLMILARRNWITAAVAWLLLVAGLVIGGDVAGAFFGAGAVVLLVGAAGMTRGAIFAGSPRTKAHGEDPTLFRDAAQRALRRPSKKGRQEDDDVKMESVELTHPFWGP